MGQQLRVMYGEVMNQGVPDCYDGLLRQLDAVDQAAGHPHQEPGVLLLFGEK